MIKQDKEAERNEDRELEEWEKTNELSFLKINMRTPRSKGLFLEIAAVED